VPGFPVSPLRGWSDGMFHFLSTLAVATQTQRAFTRAGKMPAPASGRAFAAGRNLRVARTARPALS